MSSDRLVVRSSLRIPNSNKERPFEIIEETVLFHSNASIDRKIYFARWSTCKLLSRGYRDDILTVNQEETDNKINLLSKT